MKNMAVIYSVFLAFNAFFQPTMFKEGIVEEKFEVEKKYTENIETTFSEKTESGFLVNQFNDFLFDFKITNNNMDIQLPFSYIQNIPENIDIKKLKIPAVTNKNRGKKVGITIDEGVASVPAPNTFEIVLGDIQEIDLYSLDNKRIERIAYFFEPIDSGELSLEYFEYTGNSDNMINEKIINDKDIVKFEYEIVAQEQRTIITENNFIYKVKFKDFINVTLEIEEKEYALNDIISLKFNYQYDSVVNFFQEQTMYIQADDSKYLINNLKEKNPNILEVLSLENGIYKIRFIPNDSISTLNFDFKITNELPGLYNFNSIFFIKSNNFKGNGITTVDTTKLLEETNIPVIEVVSDLKYEIKSVLPKIDISLNKNEFLANEKAKLKLKIEPFNKQTDFKFSQILAASYASKYLTLAGPIDSNFNVTYTTDKIVTGTSLFVPESEITDWSNVSAYMIDGSTDVYSEIDVDIVIGNNLGNYDTSIQMLINGNKIIVNEPKYTVKNLILEGSVNFDHKENREYNIDVFKDNILVTSVPLDENNKFSIELEKGIYELKLNGFTNYDYVFDESRINFQESIQLKPIIVIFKEFKLSVDKVVTIEAAIEMIDYVKLFNIKASDSLDGDLSLKVKHNEIISSLIPGKYSIDFEVENSRKEIKKTNAILNIIDTTSPIVNSKILEKTIMKTEKKVDLVNLFEISATDLVDQNVTIELLTNIDLNQTGTMELIFKISDYSNNTVVIKRKITIVDYTVSGSVYEDLNYDSKNNDKGLKNVIIFLIDGNSNQILDQTKSDESGYYQFSLANRNVSTFKIKVDLPIHYIIANKSYDSVINVNDLKSDVFINLNIDYKNFNIGVGKDLVANISKNNDKVYLNEKSYSIVITKNGTFENTLFDKSRINVVRNKNELEITALKKGTNIVTIQFKNRYGRISNVQKNIEITTKE